MSTLARILVSSCLLGHPVRYHGRSASCESEAAAFLERNGTISVIPRGKD